MKNVLGCMKKADNDFQLISNGDKIAVSLSGGKDSVTLLKALTLYKMFSKKDFSLCAITVSMGFDGFSSQPLQMFCAELGVDYIELPSDIANILFNIRKEKNPCALCAKMRRGMVNETAARRGCNKIALGHHRDDALETFFLCLLQESRMSTLPPKTYLSRSDVTVIRPFLYLPESQIVRVHKKLRLPLCKNPCPANGYTRRKDMSNLIDHISKTWPAARSYMLNALINTDQYNLWDKYKTPEEHE